MNALTASAAMHRQFVGIGMSERHDGTSRR